MIIMSSFGPLDRDQKLGVTDKLVLSCLLGFYLGKLQLPVLLVTLLTVPLPPVTVSTADPTITTVTLLSITPTILYIQPTDLGQESNILTFLPSSPSVTFPLPLPLLPLFFSVAISRLLLSVLITVRKRRSQVCSPSLSFC